MAESSESRDVAMSGVDVGLSNGPSTKATREKGVGEHVTNGHLEAENQTASGSPDNGQPSLSKLLNGHSTSPKKALSTDEAEPTGTRHADEHQVQPPLPERKEPSHSPKEVRTPAKPVQATPESIKIDKEVARLKEVLNETSALAAQKVLREEWRTFLFEGFPEEHLSFILRAILKNSSRSPRVIDNLLNDGPALEKLLDRPTLLAKILGACSHTQISKHVPTPELDKALAERLKNVEAMSLVRWLAEANRLGYKTDDILDEEDESVTPNIASRPASRDLPEVFQVEVPRPHLNLAPPQHDSLLVEQERNLAAAKDATVERRQTQSKGQTGTCPSCGATFPTFSGYSYHVSKKPCEKVPPAAGFKFSCPNCLTRFANSGGKAYHDANRCCLHEGETRPATSPSAQLQLESLQQQHIPPRSQPTPSYPPIRPPTHSQPGSSAPIPIPSRPGGPSPLSRPPISTAAPAQATPVSSNVRRFMSELSPKELAAVNAELADAQSKYEESVAKINETYSGAELQLKLVTAKNGINTKLSQIRAKHGVTLRMRKADKEIRKVAGVTPPNRNRNSQGTAPSVLPAGTPIHVSPPTSSFSPVNASPSGSNGVPARYPTPRLPPMTQTPAQRSYFPTSNPSGDAPPSSSSHPPNTLPQGRANIDRPSGFGVMKMVPAYETPYSMSNKRRRSEDHESPRPEGPGSSPRPQPWFANTQNRTVSQPQPPAAGLTMMEMRSEDAASKLASLYKSDPRPASSGPIQAPKDIATTGSRPGSSGAGMREGVIFLTDTESEPEGDTAAPLVAPLVTEAEAEPEVEVLLARSIEKDDDVSGAGNSTETESELQKETEKSGKGDSDREERAPTRLRGMRAKRSGKR